MISAPLRPWSCARRVVLVRIVHLAVLGVAVAPQQQLLQHEEAEDAAEDRERRLVRVARLEGVRNHLEERRAEQRADGERHQHRDPGCAQRRARTAASAGGERAAGDARSEDPAERHGGGDSTVSQISGCHALASSWSRRYEKKRSRLGVGAKAAAVDRSIHAACKLRRAPPHTGRAASGRARRREERVRVARRKPRARPRRLRRRAARSPGRATPMTVAGGTLIAATVASMTPARKPAPAGVRGGDHAARLVGEAAPACSRPLSPRRRVPRLRVTAASPFGESASHPGR